MTDAKKNEMALAVENAQLLRNGGGGGSIVVRANDFGSVGERKSKTKYTDIS